VLGSISLIDKLILAIYNGIPLSFVVTNPFKNSITFVLLNIFSVSSLDNKVPFFNLGIIYFSNIYLYEAISLSFLSLNIFFPEEISLKLGSNVIQSSFIFIEKFNPLINYSINNSLSINPILFS